MLSPIVVGVDGSAECLAAGAWAAREAIRQDRPLRLVNAWDRRPRQGQAIVNAAQRQMALRALRRAEDRVRAEYPDIRIRDEQTEGLAVPALLEAADRAALLVLGSRGQSGFTGFLVGSVALGVVARATCPVVLVRADEEAMDEHLPEADGRASTQTAYRDVVLAVDVGDSCDEVIEFAFEAARLRRARLRVVYAWQAPSPFGRGSRAAGLVENPWRGEEWLCFLKASLQLWRDKYPEVHVLETVVEEKPSSALVRASTGASLLVVGRRVTERPVGPRTGPVTHAAIHHAGCPVAVVPHM